VTIGTSLLYGLEFFAQGETARKNGLEIRECDLTQTWPCEDGEFDVVLSNQVLEHIPNTDHFFQELHRILKPGGYAVVSTPNLGSWVHIAMLALTIHPVHCWVSDRLCALGNPISSLRGRIREVPTHAHLRLFTPRALQEMAQAYGLLAEKLICGSYGLPVVDRIFSHFIPYYGMYATLKMRKPL
jgi:2-polyprenyl-3-methyl-5-hydroxy-6-metoxy-1,4-benzoquinol methylase